MAAPRKERGHFRSGLTLPRLRGRGTAQRWRGPGAVRRHAPSVPPLRADPPPPLPRWRMGTFRTPMFRRHRATFRTLRTHPEPHPAQIRARSFRAVRYWTMERAPLTQTPAGQGLAVLTTPSCRSVAGARARACAPASSDDVKPDTTDSILRTPLTVVADPLARQAVGARRALQTALTVVETACSAAAPRKSAPLPLDSAP